ncbi:hypothetical protein [Ilyobacter polytropus]|uniref:Uncharacterized protein n=1 Tax=Ilyobacter polytropus (strain ATCC 51220 / DSM 2926 / LMG 16218 / CuHBu1) TaxID=572544 RepID=E3HBF0_ILYPC|nr:hypothetical protein [Ilyobacter polytropus]ADO83765.1 conserved hypothetical protein [Ilyobacter polytropus DSM 2926]
MKYNDFKDIGLEVVLKVLKKIDDEIRRYRELEDYEGVNTLEKEVLTKYEKLYGAFSTDPGENIKDYNFESIEKYIYEIMKENDLSEDFINSEILKRKKYRGNSGSEAVENLYKYELAELDKKKSILLQEASEILDKELKLETELSEAIQEDEQMEILTKLPEIRSSYNKLSKKIMKLHDKMVTINEKLEKKWPIDIFGTISKDELLKVYKDAIK